MAALAADVKAEILRYAPSSWRLEELGDDLSLTGEGLGLDSVKLVELLFACEARFGVHLPLEPVAGEELTVGSLVRRIADARRPPSPGGATGESG